MNKISFKVQGSEPEPYDVTFTKEDPNLFCTCTCKAGIMGTYCKHRIRILVGDSEGITSENLNEVEIVASWLPGTQLANAIIEFQKTEAELAVADKKCKKAKKAIGYVMNPH